ncbi:tRNA (guanosine(37)-N1)-methyltransferase TrmD [Deinococcus aquiradiocola]|uniref:tRNA (guanine-N(1)-)-methyltransferase n=1 Tax=Deinococcus aquiradiocola TaxID=393059 RepID=A0A917UKP8_9DEIO|nr:tRNA (guanosine(37)-N1)-methyltransferase TrmD [Deinococcus aquiradiocola]GGJ63498.1 tRNA (guanine-N(1)-)-methyltransferase [Deinococcus aquiradiocola]
MTPEAPGHAGGDALHFSVLTLFPELLRPFTQEALLGRAAANGLLKFDLHDLREHAGNRWRKVDDTPYGGGAGMVIRVDVVERALAALPSTPDEVILLTPAGQRFDQRLAEELAGRQHIALLCGRYEGFDARVEGLVTREVSIGDYVMMGGEAAAACIMEAVGRLRPGVIGDEESWRADSYSSGLLDYPEYTRPAEWQGHGVPQVLMGGNHAAITRWRRDRALERTLARRPDLLPGAGLTPEDSSALLTLGVDADALAGHGAPPPPTPKRKRTRRPKTPQEPV